MNTDLYGVSEEIGDKAGVPHAELCAAARHEVHGPLEHAREQLPVVLHRRVVAAVKAGRSFGCPGDGMAEEVCHVATV